MSIDDELKLIEKKLSLVKDQINNLNENLKENVRKTTKIKVQDSGRKEASHGES